MEGKERLGQRRSEAIPPSTLAGTVAKQEINTMRRAIAVADSSRPAGRLLATLVLVLTSVGLSGCLVSTDGAEQQAYELNEVSGVDFDRIPRASEAATSDGPRRPDPASATEQTADPDPAAPSADDAPTADGDTDQTVQAIEVAAPEADGADAPLSEASNISEEQAVATTTQDDAIVEEPAPIEADASADATTEASDAAGAEESGPVSDQTTDEPADPAPTAVPAPTATPVTDASPASATPTSAPVPTAAPQVSQVAAAAAGPVPTDGLSVSGSAPLDANGDTAVLSQSGALACSIVELSLDELDRGDLATFDADMNTAAGFASTAPEPGLNSLASSLPTAASSPNPIDAVGAFLTACATYGYEI